MTTWKKQTIGDYIGILGWQDNAGEWHNFSVCWNDERSALVFGGPTNNTFLQSGYMTLDGVESEDDAMADLLADLETYYNDGKAYVSRIVCNERM